MINLHYCNGNVFVCEVTDWSILRKEHRIVGNIVGHSSFIETLPSLLLPEEVLLLIDKNIAKVITRVNNEPSEAMKASYKELEDKMLAEQQKLYTDKRKLQLESMIDSIVAAKRKNGDDRSPEEILNDELKKSSTVTKETMIWPIFLQSPIACDYKDVSRDTILKDTTEVKYSIFKDLWEKGYYVTTGHKFGGDFLAYEGDPILYHAVFIVRCVSDPASPLHPSEIVAFGRLASSVKKKAVLANVKDETISYITINWMDA